MYITSCNFGGGRVIITPISLMRKPRLREVEESKCTSLEMAGLEFELRSLAAKPAFPCTVLPFPRSAWWDCR